MSGWVAHFPRAAPFGASLPQHSVLWPLQMSRRGSISEPGITLRLSSHTGHEDMLISKFKFFRDMVGRRHAAITDAESISNRDEAVPCLCRGWKPPLLPHASVLQQADISQGTCWAPALSPVAFWFRFPSCLWSSWLVPPSPSSSPVFKPNQTKPKPLCSHTDRPQCGVCRLTERGLGGSPA